MQTVYSPLPVSAAGEMPLPGDDAPEFDDHHGDSYKTVVPHDAANGDTYKGVTAAEAAPNPEDDTYKTATAGGYAESEDAYIEEPKDRKAYICGLRRKPFFLLLGAITLVVVAVAAVLGGIFGSRASKSSSSDTDIDSTTNNTTQNNDTGYSGLDILPGSALTISNTNNTVRLFYQNGDGDILTKKAVYPTKLANHTDMNITDSKLFTPLSATGPVDKESEVHLFYLTSNNTVRSKPYTGSATALDTGLVNLDLQVSNSSKISAMYIPDSNQTKIYYQADDGYINEYIYSASGGWSHGGTLDKAATGTPISTAWYEEGSAFLRVYFLRTNNTLVEFNWGSGNGWHYGAAPAHVYDEGSQLYDVTWMGLDGLPSNRIYGTDRVGEVIEIGFDGDTGDWTGSAWEDKKVVGSVPSINYSVAAAQWINSNNDTIIHVFYQQEDTGLTTKIWDGSSWGDAITVDLS